MGKSEEEKLGNLWKVVTGALKAKPIQYAKKTKDSVKLIVSRLPAYNPKNDDHLTNRTDSYFYESEKELLKEVTRMIVAEDEFYMEDKKGKRIYEIRYDKIDKIMHKQRGKPVYIYAIDKKGFSDRIPFPTWSSTFEQDILETIAERAHLEEQIELQEFRGATIYYGRK